jgi:hypothetical protein
VYVETIAVRPTGANIIAISSARAVGLRINASETRSPRAFPRTQQKSRWRACDNRLPSSRAGYRVGFLKAAISPANPVPSRSKVEGSGTGVATGVATNPSVLPARSR